MAENQQQQQQQQQRDADEPFPMEGAVGASDGDSGGGAASGTPDAELAARAGDAVIRGDVRQDREKLFPETSEVPNPGEDADDETAER